LPNPSSQTGSSLETLESTRTNVPAAIVTATPINHPELEDLNNSLRERDKVKDDAIAHLSDQLMAISTRLQDLEQKQQTIVTST
jgi:hypothetical protein